MSDPVIQIISRLQNQMHMESATASPQTTETIEVMREAKAEIERLRAENARIRGESYCPICGHYHYPRCNRRTEP
jgi:hypothetical protein